MTVSLPLEPLTNYTIYFHYLLIHCYNTSLSCPSAFPIEWQSALSDHRSSLSLSSACEVLSPALLVGLGSVFSSARGEDADWAWRANRLIVGRAFDTHR